MKRLTVVIEERLHNKAKSEAYKEGKTLKDKIIQLLNKWLEVK